MAGAVVVDDEGDGKEFDKDFEAPDANDEKVISKVIADSLRDT
eukprot:SAG11_NODE_47729_length_127_cov_218.464286_1_plen_42_part_11